MADRKDKYYVKAKKDNFLSRAVYKLSEIQEKFSIIREQDTVLEIGSAPGGWTQFLLSINGVKVISVDRSPYQKLDGATQIRKDIFSDEIWGILDERLSSMGVGGFNVVLSDAMSHTSGNHSRDHASSYLICDRVMSIAERLLLQGGNAVIKHFQGDLTKNLIEKWSGKFRGYKITTPKASRSGSREIYIIFFNLRERP
ncbi:MAG: RlmE family RNA methyltransferase [Thermoplasmataceae archaeon]